LQQAKRQPSAQPQGRADSPTPHCVPAGSAENYRDFSLNIYAFIPRIPHIILCIAALMQ